MFSRSHSRSRSPSPTAVLDTRACGCHAQCDLEVKRTVTPVGERPEKRRRKTITGEDAYEYGTDKPKEFTIKPEQEKPERNASAFCHICRWKFSTLEPHLVSVGGKNENVNGKENEIEFFVCKPCAVREGTCKTCGKECEKDEVDGDGIPSCAKHTDDPHITVSFECTYCHEDAETRNSEGEIVCLDHEHQHTLAVPETPSVVVSPDVGGEGEEGGKVEALSDTDDEGVRGEEEMIACVVCGVRDINTRDLGEDEMNIAGYDALPKGHQGYGHEQCYVKAMETDPTLIEIKRSDVHACCYGPHYLNAEECTAMKLCHKDDGGCKVNRDALVKLAVHSGNAEFEEWVNTHALICPNDFVVHIAETPNIYAFRVQFEDGGCEGMYMFTHMKGGYCKDVSMPSTPTGQPTQAASTNAPRRLAGEDVELDPHSTSTPCRVLEF